jgi:hypothetical protein
MAALILTAASFAINCWPVQRNKRCALLGAQDEASAHLVAYEARDSDHFQHGMP